MKISSKALIKSVAASAVVLVGSALMTSFAVHQSSPLLAQRSIAVTELADRGEVSAETGYTAALILDGDNTSARAKLAKAHIAKWQPQKAMNVLGEGSNETDIKQAATMASLELSKKPESYAGLELLNATVGGEALAQELYEIGMPQRALYELKRDNTRSLYSHKLAVAIWRTHPGKSNDIYIRDEIEAGIKKNPSDMQLIELRRDLSMKNGDKAAAKQDQQRIDQLKSGRF